MNRKRLKNLLRLLENSDSDEAPRNNIINDDSSDDGEEEPPKKRRRRIMHIDSSDEEEEAEKTQDNILELIGEPEPVKNTIKINQKLADLWRNIIEKGLNKDVKKTLQEKTPTIENCLLEAPKLNEELKVTLSKNATTREEKLCEKQSQIGLAMATLNKVLKSLIDKNDKENIEPLGDVIRLLADLHFMESQTRRAVILPGLNKSMKESLENTGITNLLFGTDLHKVIKRSKDLEKTRKDLQQKPSTSKTPLNYWGPSPYTSSQPQGGQRRPLNQSYLNRIRNHQRNYYRGGQPPARNVTAQSQWPPRRPARGRRPSQQVMEKKI